MSPPPLLSLHSDILLLILPYVLIDTPRSPTRAAILRTCSALHSLGHPFLYEVIDLTGIKKGKHIVEAWTGLFGEEAGLLTENGRLGADWGRKTRELRLGGAEDLEMGDWDDFNPSETLAKTLPRLHTLYLDQKSLGRFNCPFVLGPLITQLPIKHLSMYSPYGDGEGDQRQRNYLMSPTARRRNETLEQALLDLEEAKQPEAWKGLETISHQESVWYLGPRLFLSTWTVKTIILERLVEPDRDDIVDHMCESWVEKEQWGDEDSTYPTIERLEIRCDASYETEFRRCAALRGVGGTDEEQETLRKRVLDKIVFLREGDPNAEETWLVPRKGEKKVAASGVAEEMKKEVEESYA